MRGLAARMMAFDFAAHEWALSFVAEQAGSTVSMATGSYVDISGTPPTVFLEYSTNGYTWQTFTVGTTTVTLAKVGDTVWFRAPHGITNTAFSTEVYIYNGFVLTGAVIARGSVMSLINGDSPTFALSSKCALACLFRGCTSLIAAPALPATTLADDCYVAMFEGCTSLTAAPALPATTMADNCYSAMFWGCTSLTAAPALPATTLVDFCYLHMFRGCTSLIAAPALPATTLADNCYRAMFEGCTALTAAPALPATTLAYECYFAMFSGCTALTTAPALSATTLANSCYLNMFWGCTSLTAAPVLHATTLATGCYFGMFKGCTSLREVEVAFSSWTPANATVNWLSGVSSTGTLRCPTALGTDATITRGESNCPTGWTVVNTD